MEEMNRTDWLALERTKLANDRTFLAYFRTFVVVLSSGFAIIKIEILQGLATLGYTFIITAILMLTLGTIRFFAVKRRMDKHISPPLKMNESQPPR